MNYGNGKRIKIYKTATDVSLMDIIDALDYHKTNEKNEEVYKGNIMFTINEYGRSKIQQSAYLSKDSAKAVFYSILNHHFPKIYENGFQEHGGGRNKKNEIRKRVFTIRYEPEHHRYRFQIDEGPGRINDKGGYDMIKREHSVRTYVPYLNAIKMAQEVYTYIIEAEIVSMLKGKPYYTIVPATPLSSNGNGQSYAQNQNYIEETNPEPYNQNPYNPYIIKFGKWKGTPISRIDTNTLETLLSKLTPKTPEIEELIREIKNELNRRYT